MPFSSQYSLDGRCVIEKDELLSKEELLNPKDQYTTSSYTVNTSKITSFNNILNPMGEYIYKICELVQNSKKLSQEQLDRETFELKKNLIQSAPDLIRFEDQSNMELIKLAIKSNGESALNNIHTKTDEIIEFAIKTDPNNVKYIRILPEKLQEICVNHDVKLIKYIDNLKDNIGFLALDKCKTKIDLNWVIKSLDIENIENLYDYYVIKYTSLGE